MTTTKTTVVLEAQTRNIEKSTRDVQKLYGAMDPAATAKGFKKVDDAVAHSVKAVRGFGREMQSASGASAFKRMTEAIKESGYAVDELAKKEKAAADARAKAAEAEEKKKRKNSFRMGVLQGAGVGEYFPEGGLGRNAAGRGVGGMARGAASVAAGSFQGASGFANGFSAIPVVGGFLSGVMQNLFSTAQEFYGLTQAAGGVHARTSGIYGSKDADGNPIAAFASHLNGQGASDLAGGNTSRFGVNKTSVMQMIGEMLQASGGLGDMATETTSKELVGSMLGASKFGVSASTVGTIYRAEKQNNLLQGGQETSTSETLNRALATAMRTGLDTSDMISAIASGIEDGMPFDPGSLMELTERFAAKGMTGESALIASQGVQRLGRNMASSGPQNGAEFHAMQSLFGYGAGGDYSAASLWESKKNARTGNVNESGVTKMLEGFSNSGMSKEGKLIAAQGYLQKLGIDMSEQDMEAIMGPDTSDRASILRAKFEAKASAEMPTIANAGATITEGATARRSSTEDRRLDTGSRMLGTVEDFEDSQARLMNEISKYVGPMSAQVSGLIKDISAAAQGGNFFSAVITLLGQAVTGGRP